MPNQEPAFSWPFGNGPVSQWLFRPCLKTFFAAPFNPARLTALGLRGWEDVHPSSDTGHHRTFTIWSIDSCQNRIATEQYPMTISQAHVSSHRGDVIYLEAVRWPVNCFTRSRTMFNLIPLACLGAQENWYCTHIGHHCFDQLTAVKTGYPLTSIIWPYRGLRCRPIEVKYFLEVIHWQVTSFQVTAGWSSIFFQIHMKYVVFMCCTIKILIANHIKVISHQKDIRYLWLFNTWGTNAVAQ